MTLPPTRYQTRVQTPRIPKSKIRDSVIYHELEYLGKGSFGRVSRVIDLQWGGIMAVKIINVERQKEKEVKETLKREVELLAKLSHPHIIDYKHSQGWEFGEPIEIFMSAADGSLRAFLDDRRSQHMKLTSKQITHVSRHIVSALHYLHGEKIIHRDIKPENILFKDIFTNPIFSLADFGFSKEIDSKATFVGTPLYWAPEVCSGAPQDFRVDIWSLGVVIYEMLTGLALDQLPDLTNLVFTSGEWCERLDHACRGGSDLAKMVTLNVENRTTIDMCYGSSTFPVLPDALPSPVARVPTQAPPSPISRTTLQQHPRRHKSRNPLAGGTHYRVEKAQVPLQVQPFRRLQEIGRKPPQI
ncbi:serine/threonine protein kinase [Ptychographa xylographoides]|nr:serine/threonine protein kinase [Ptychographa xylographoides]